MTMTSCTYMYKVGSRHFFYEATHAMRIFYLFKYISLATLLKKGMNLGNLYAENEKGKVIKTISPRPLSKIYPTRPTFVCFGYTDKGIVSLA